MMVLRLLLILVWALANAAQAHTGQPLGAIDIAAYSQQWIDAALAKQPPMPELPLRMEVHVGKLDPRLRLAPCQQIQPWLPSGSRLWGRTRLGLRCADAGVRWNMFVPMTVKAFGPAWVLNHKVAAGTVLSAQDAVPAEVDWAAQSAPIVARQTDWLGQTAIRTLTAGKALRRNMLRPVQAFRSGAVVRVLMQGTGYTVTTSGRALAVGRVGHTVRVRLDNGRVVMGTVAENGVVTVM